MKNSKVILGMLVLALAFGLVFSGCVQEIKGDVTSTQPTASAPSDVTTVKLTATNGVTTSYYVVVKWKAAADASNYSLYYKEEGKNTAQSLSGSYPFAQNDVVYSSSTISLSLTQTYNTDRDAWSASYNYSLLGTGLNNWSGKRFRFGVSASSVNPNTTNSGIVWSEPVTF